MRQSEHFRHGSDGTLKVDIHKRESETLKDERLCTPKILTLCVSSQNKGLCSRLHETMGLHYASVIHKQFDNKKPTEYFLN
jgi:hypothetical protein